MERLADGEGDPSLVEQVKEEARKALHDVDVRSLATSRSREEGESTQRLAAEAAFTLVTLNVRGAAYADRAMRGYVGQSAPEWHCYAQRCSQLCDLFQDIFGNPFQHISVRPAWLRWNGGAILKLDQAIYRDRTFDRLPILADALEDAGCTDRAILAHLRGPGPHVRGCWVVDLLLGKQ
jgi:hypothetical protein